MKIIQQINHAPNNAPFERKGDVVIAELFYKSSHEALFNFDNLSCSKNKFLTNTEIRLFETAPVQLGLAIDNGTMILYWNIGGKDGLTAITLFDARLYEDKQDLTLDTTNNTVFLELVEDEYSAVVAQRIITLPNTLFENLRSACKHQISDKAAPIGSHSPMWNIWPIEKLGSCFDTGMIYEIS